MRSGLSTAELRAKMLHTMSPSTQPPTRAGRILESNPFPLLLVCVIGILLLVVLAPSLIVGDSWLTLMAGREVVHNGLPTNDEITLLSNGGIWTNQQWLAQVVFYGAHTIGGIKTVVLLDILLVLLTLSLGIATARKNGATARSTFLVALLSVVAGPWGWTIRAQAVALPFFAGTLWLLVDASRRGLRRRTLFVLPLLVVWANLHGSVVIGAGLTVVLGATEVVRRRGSTALAVTLIVAAPLCILASPYATKLPAYYKLMLIDAPFSETLREWHWSNPSGTTLFFYLLVALMIVLVATPRARRRLTVFELLTLAILLFGAIDAIRGVIWFALATMAILPLALDGLIGKPDVVAPRANRVISIIGIIALAIAVAIALVLPTSWFASSWPEREVRAVRAATLEPKVRIFATDRHSDWLLWRIPSLRSRMAFDVRFELYDRKTIEDIVRYNGELGPKWKRITDGYEVVLLDARKPPSHLKEFLADPGARVVFRDGEVVLVKRPPA